MSQTTVATAEADTSGFFHQDAINVSTPRAPVTPPPPPPGTQSRTLSSDRSVHSPTLFDFIAERPVAAAATAERLAESCVALATAYNIAATSVVDKRTENQEAPAGITQNVSYDEACLQLETHRSAMEHEQAELQLHYGQLKTDTEVKQELAEVRLKEFIDMQEELQSSEKQLADTLSELRTAQDEASEQLLERKRIQCEVHVCVGVFRGELEEQRAAAAELSEQRASLRASAVKYGQELQTCVVVADELVSENLRLHSELSTLEAETERLRSIPSKLAAADENLIQEVPSLCSRLRRDLGDGSLSASARRRNSPRRLPPFQWEAANNGPLSPFSAGGSASSCTPRALAKDLQPPDIGNGLKASTSPASRFTKVGTVSPDKRKQLLNVLERQDRQLLLLQQATQRLSGHSYVPGPEPADDVDRAVAAAFLDLGCGISPPLVRLRGDTTFARHSCSPGEVSNRTLFLFQTSICEARVDPAAGTGGADLGLGVKFRLVALGRRSDQETTPSISCEDWLTAAELAHVVGWAPARHGNRQKVQPGFQGQVPSTVPVMTG